MSNNCNRPPPSTGNRIARNQERHTKTIQGVESIITIHRQRLAAAEHNVAVQQVPQRQQAAHLAELQRRQVDASDRYQAVSALIDTDPGKTARTRHPHPHNPPGRRRSDHTIRPSLRPTRCQLRYEGSEEVRLRMVRHSASLAALTANVRALCGRDSSPSTLGFASDLGAVASSRLRGLRGPLGLLGQIRIGNICM